VAGHQIVIGTSIGIAFAPQDGVDGDELLKKADLALYRAKVDGRGICRLFHAEMDAEMQARRLLELDLRKALRARQFELFYQPVVDLHAGAVAGFEALLRWRHPERGLVSPASFIPLAEEIGLIVQIGEWVLREACATAASWPGDIRVAVNLSAAQFKSPDLVATVSEALREGGLLPDRLELEITETVMLQDTDATMATLHQLRALGAGIAMDDFGTGYSSLSYLRRFPFDRIKIDQSFVRELSSKRDCGAIVRAVAGLSRELGMATTAEGVETREPPCLPAPVAPKSRAFCSVPPYPVARLPDCWARSRRCCGGLSSPRCWDRSNSCSRKRARERRCIPHICHECQPNCTRLQQRELVSWTHKTRMCRSLGCASRSKR
jgi:predicted signal transduction protein with EAL and GGDEF domain